MPDRKTTFQFWHRFCQCMGESDPKNSTTIRPSTPSTRSIARSCRSGSWIWCSSIDCAGLAPEIGRGCRQTGYAQRGNYSTTKQSSATPTKVCMRWSTISHAVSWHGKSRGVFRPGSRHNCSWAPLRISTHKLMRSWQRRGEILQGRKQSHWK